MTESDAIALLIEVCPADEPLRRERLTRLLRSELQAELGAGSGVTVDFADPPPAGSAQDGTKGPLDWSEAGLWLALTVTAKSAAQVAVAAIRAWCERERGRTVRLTRDGVTVEIPANLDERQERLVNRLVEREDR